MKFYIHQSNIIYSNFFLTQKQLIIKKLSINHQISRKHFLRDHILSRKYYLLPRISASRYYKPKLKFKKLY